MNCPPLRLLLLSLLCGLAVCDEFTRDKRQFGFGGFGDDLPMVGSSGAGSLVHGAVDTIKSTVKAATGCFTNSHGYKCCSLPLSLFLDTTFKIPFVETLLDALDLQKAVNKILEMVQNNFGMSFEIVMSPADFASKNTFRGDFMCKTKTPKGKVILIYATPVPYSTVLGENRPLSAAEIKAKGWSSQLLQVSELSFASNRTRRDVFF